jgi:hypothetical protein
MTAENFLMLASCGNLELEFNSDLLSVSITNTHTFLMDRVAAPSQTRGGINWAEVRLIINRS